MKTVILFITLIFIVAIGYTAFGIMTFEPEKPAPLVFEEPSPEALKSLGIYEEAVDTSVPLTASQQQQANQALDKIAQAMTIYQKYEQSALPQFKTSMSMLNSAIAGGKLPAYFLTVTSAQSAKRNFQTLTLDPADVMEISSQSTLACISTPIGTTDILVGDDAPNKIECLAPDSLLGRDQVFLGGPGNDEITDTLGNRIINAGTGDDTIKLGPGRTIVILEDGWGKDTLTVDCVGARVSPDQIPNDFPVPWVAKTTNFIVLSPRINMESVKIDGNVLRNTANGDTLTMNDNCFTLVSVTQ